MDTWMTRLCCQEDMKKIVVQNFRKVPQGIEIKFGEIIKDSLRIEFFKLEDDKLNLIEETKLIGEKQEVILGSKESTSSTDGNYRVNITSNHSCGEIIFSLRNSKITKENYLCMNKRG